MHQLFALERLVGLKPAQSESESLGAEWDVLKGEGLSYLLKCSTSFPMRERKPLRQHAEAFPEDFQSFSVIDDVFRTAKKGLVLGGMFTYTTTDNTRNSASFITPHRI
jgi:hypothetical protein